MTAEFCKYLSERQAADYLGLSVRTLQRWRAEPPQGGAPSFIKLGPRRVAYRQAELDRWADSRSFASTSEFENAAA